MEMELKGSEDKRRVTTNKNDPFIGHSRGSVELCLLLKKCRVKRIERCKLHMMLQNTFLFE